MSAQRRTATKRATVNPAAPSPSAAAASPPARPPATAAAARPANGAAAASQERPARAAERTKAAAAQPSGFAQRTEGLRRLARDTWAETKKINWPDSQTTRNLTIVVIGISAVLGIVLGGIDFLFLKLLEALP